MSDWDYQPIEDAIKEAVKKLKNKSIIQEQQILIEKYWDEVIKFLKESHPEEFI